LISYLNIFELSPSILPETNIELNLSLCFSLGEQTLFCFIRTFTYRTEHADKPKMYKLHNSVKLVQVFLAIQAGLEQADALSPVLYSIGLNYVITEGSCEYID